jgi:membrane-associated phospholipid phosphatase
MESSVRRMQSPSTFPKELGSPRPCLWTALGFALAGCGALAIDVSVSHWLLTRGLPDDLRRFVDLCEVFGHGFGVALILLTVWVLDPHSHRKMARVATMSFGAGVLANTGKLLVARMRPTNFDFSGNVFATFDAWLPLLGNTSREQGFPSSHVATAVGLALALTWLYPRGRGLFFCLAALVAAQRLASGAHFLSDTLWGSAIAFLVCGVLRVQFAFNARWLRWENGGSKQTSLVRTNRRSGTDTPLAA